MPDVLALGEMLIDFVPTTPGLGVEGTPTWERVPGGAPANVAVGVARLGVSAGFLGKVGDDPFGHLLAATLRENAVDVRGLCFTATARTALAFVALAADGERDFVFYRHPSADMLYAPDDVDAAAIASARILHFGSISAISEPSRSATLRAIEIAQQHQLLISFDPNLRLPLWSSAAAARTTIRSLFPSAHVIKVSVEELEFLTGEADIERAARSLWHPALRLLAVTQGPGGCTYVLPAASGHVPAPSVQASDTTGAGDSFTAALLAQLAADPALLDQPAALAAALRFACAAGAITTTRRGAIPALPTRAEITALLG